MTICLNTLLEKEAVASRLTHADLTADAAEQLADQFHQAGNALINTGIAESAPAHAFFVPGRIEVLGKHTDYAGGRSLIATTEKGFCLAAHARSDNVLHITNTPTAENAKFKISADLAGFPGHWKNYPMSVAQRLARNFGEQLYGADIAFASNLPPAAGMSSSSAFVVAIFMALAAVNKLNERQEYRQNIDSSESLAEYLSTMENGLSYKSLTADQGIGTLSGSEDHTAMLCCRPQTLSQYSYCPVRFERFIAVPTKYIFVVAASGVIAEKAGTAQAKYNRASNMTSVIIQAWQKATGRNDPHLAAAIANNPDSIDQMHDILRDINNDIFTRSELLHRFDHFLYESEKILPAAADALAADDLREFGYLVDQSQSRTEALLGNQIPETIFLAQSARQAGALAASAFGAGFGGSVWALINKKEAADFLRIWAQRYQTTYPDKYLNACFFLTSPGPAAFELS